jgi:iron complex transport system ATP-binding protein
MGEALRLERVAVTRGGRTVLQPLSLTHERGSVLAVLGPNGAGKTTLLNAVAGFVPFSGEIRIDGEPLQVLPRRERARRLAYVPQVSRLDAPMPVRDVVAQGRYAHRSALGGLDGTDRSAVDRALEVTDVARFSDRPFTALSHGERRRVLVARALATGARLLLLDEPTSALDIAQALTLFTLLRTLAGEGYSVVVVLHVLDEARRCADRTLLLHEGRCEALGATHEVIAPGPIARVYGVELIAEGGLTYRALQKAGGAQ